MRYFENSDPVRRPFSPLARSAAARLGWAAIASLLLWLAVWWALA
jgi:hypothetical protein